MVVAQQDREEVLKSVKKLEVNQDVQEVSEILCCRGVKDVKESWVTAVEASWGMWETNAPRRANNFLQGLWNTGLNW